MFLFAFCFWLIYCVGKVITVLPHPWLPALCYHAEQVFGNIFSRLTVYSFARVTSWSHLWKLISLLWDHLLLLCSLLQSQKALLEASLEGEGRNCTLKLKRKNHEKDGCKRQSSAQLAVGTWEPCSYNPARRKGACTYIKSLNHFNGVYCFLGHTVLVCKTWLSCFRSLTISSFKNNSTTCLLVLTQGTLPGCLFALPAAARRDHSTGPLLSTTLEVHLR